MSPRRRSGSSFSAAAAAAGVDCAKCCDPIKKSQAVCEGCDRAWHPTCAGIKHGGGAGEGAGRGWRCGKCSTEAEGDRESFGAGDGDGEWQPAGRRQRQQSRPLPPREDPSVGSPPPPPRRRQQSEDDEGYFWDNELACPGPAPSTDDIANPQEKHLDMQKAISNLQKEMCNLQTERKQDRNTMRRLKIRQEAQAQDVNSKNLEIQGLFERAGEDLVALVLRLFALKAAAAAAAAAAAEAAGGHHPAQYGITSVAAEDIVSCTRLVHSTLRPKPVVVAFRDKKKRDGVYRARFCGRVRWRDLAQGGVAAATEDPELLAHVNPHLTPHFRKLLNLCKRVCDRQGLPPAACWYSNCKVYVRRRKEQPAFVVEVAEDLHEAFPDARSVVEKEIDARKPGASAGPGAVGVALRHPPHQR